MSPESDEAVQRLLSLQKPDESDAAFAGRIGITPQAVSNYKNGHHSLSLTSALRVTEVTGVSLDWLLAGRGSPGHGQQTDEGEGFDEGGAYVLRRLLRSVLSVVEDARRAGMISDDDAEAICDPIESYLEETA